MSANQKMDTIWHAIEHGLNLEVRCGNTRCNHSSIVSARQMARRIQLERWSEQIELIGMHVRCTKCGHKGGWVRAKGGTPNGPKVGPSSDAELKARIRLKRG